jgi:tetratricopeptide (TPR) repeat protein
LTAACGLAHPGRVKRSLAIAVGSLALAAAPGVGAEGVPEATRLFEEGRVLADQGKLAEACERFAKSHELERAAGTMLNLGDCAEREGDLRRAWLLYDAAAREYEEAGKEKSARFARGRADALAPKLATVMVRLAEPRAAGLTVRIGGRAVSPAAEIVERLPAGEIPIEVGAPGREPFATTARAAVGDQVIVVVPALRGVGGVTAAPPEPRPDRAPPDGRRRGRVILAGGAAGIGVLALGAAGVLAVGARSAYRRYEDELEAHGCATDCSAADYALAVPYYDRAALRADLATGFVIGGAALVAAGAILYVTAPRGRRTIAPSASAHAASVTASIRF